MSRRRNRAATHLSRMITFGPALGVPVWAWRVLREPLHLTGLAVMTVGGVIIIPAVIVLAVFLVPRGGSALVPRSWRKRYRYRRPRGEQRSARISVFLRRVTFFADRYRCAYCRRRYPVHLLNVDHYVPWSQGGLTTVWNTMTLCQACNLTKSNYWRGVFYRPVPGYDDIGLAVAILMAERRHRYNLVRLTRAAWALGA